MKEFIITLPTDNLERTFAFYKALGLELAREAQGDAMPEPLEFRLTKTTVLMFAPRDGFAVMTSGNAVASRDVSEGVLSMVVDTNAAVDQVIALARAAGAQITFEPSRQFMGYAGSFKDLDGHVWMVVHSDS